jgi:hypothetical protein
MSVSDLCIPVISESQIYNVLSPNFRIHVSVSNLYLLRIGLPILLQPYIGRPILGIYESLTNA